MAREMVKREDIDFSKAILLGMPSPKGITHCKNCGKSTSGHVQVAGGYACNVNCAIKALEKEELIRQKKVK